MENKKELLKALFEAKKEIGKISKDSNNPFFKSKYFDINQLLEHVEPVFEKHGLIILQPITEGKVISYVIHVETGQSIESYIELSQITDPQKIGSAITYYRRYTLQSLLSLQAEDDDGNKASGNTDKKQSKDNNQGSKPWLNRTSKEGVLLENYTKIIEGARAKGSKLADLQKHFMMREETKEFVKKDLGG
jgi:hypothetical protein